jgi:UDP:flavonoid glycosyltransferase YjiC (YdhE family)
LLRPAADLCLELDDRGLQRLLAVFDRALELLAEVRWNAVLGFAESLSAGSHRSVYQPRSP